MGRFPDSLLLYLVTMVSWGGPSLNVMCVFEFGHLLDVGRLVRIFLFVSPVWPREDV